jgi:arrestin-related trafficking adapter 9
MGLTTSSAQPKSSPKDDASNGSSFLRRLAFPIRSRARHVTDFSIRPADPHRKYGVGQHVYGSVALTVIKGVRISHLRVTLHGYVRAYKSPDGVNDPPPVSADISGGSSTEVKYLGNGQASLFQDEQVLSSDGFLKAGKYEFGFDLLFPETGLPGSIDVCYCVPGRQPPMPLLFGANYGGIV